MTLQAQLEKGYFPLPTRQSGVYTELATARCRESAFPQ